MKAEELNALLANLAPEALLWGKGKDLHTFWTTCPHYDWLLKLYGRISDDPGWPTHEQFAIAVFSCALTASQFFRAEDDRPKKAIEVQRAWFLRAAD
jgi:hypothetical protein